MTRGTIDGLQSPYPLIDAMPGLYQDDDFAPRFMAAFDQVLAPVFSSLDNLPAYLDPALTPDDFLEWLAGWVGALLDETWPLERRREFVRMAADLHRRRGTVGGLRDHLRIFCSGDVEIRESGSATWSASGNSRVAAPAGPLLHVRVIQDRQGDVDPAKLESLVAAAKPAHIPHRTELVTRGRDGATGGGGPSRPAPSGGGAPAGSPPGGSPPRPSPPGAPPGARSSGGSPAGLPPGRPASGSMPTSGDQGGQAGGPPRTTGPTPASGVPSGPPRGAPAPAARPAGNAPPQGTRPGPPPGNPQSRGG
jgi:phage tail-like protein